MQGADRRPIDLLLDGGWVLSPGGSEFLADHAVAIVGNRIVSVGPSADVRAAYVATKTIDCTGSAVLPGLVDAHLHTCQQLARGLADDIPVLEWLTRVVALEAGMDDEAIRASVRLACLEMIRGGTTAFIEACANPVFVDVVAEEVLASGLRAALTRSTMEYQEPDWVAPDGFLMDYQANLDATRDLIDRWNGQGDGRLSAWVGWRQQWNISDKLTVDLIELARDRGVGLHGHLSTRRYGQIEHLDSLGVLGPDLVFGHAIRFTRREQDLIAHYGVKINHNPGASMHGAYGSAVAGSFPELYARGVDVCLGCDGAANGNTVDMWQVTRLAATLHKEVRQDATVISAREALDMATRRGGRALGRDDIGVLREGAVADLQVIDLRRPHLVPLSDIVANLVYCASAQDVTTTIVDGHVLMENGKVLVYDEDEVLDDAMRVGARLADVVRAGRR